MFIFAEFNVLPLILNVLMLVSLLIPIIVGIKNGFVKTAFRFGKLLICVSIAFGFCKKLGLFLKEKFLYQFVRGKVSTLVYDCLGDVTDATAESLSNSVPSGMQGLLSAFGVETEKVAEDAIANGGDVIENMINSVSGALSGVAALIVAFIGLFLVSLLLVGLVGLILNQIVTHLPVLKQINTVLGGVFGLLMGLVSTWILAQGLVTVLGLLGVDYTGAKVLLFFHHGSPFRLLIKAILSGADAVLAAMTVTGVNV